MNAPRTITLQDGRTVALRRPVEADAQAMIDYMDAVRRETNQIYACAQEPLWTLEQERQFIRDMNAPDALCVLAWLGDELVGMISVHRLKRYKQRHVAVLGMTVRRALRRRGIGRAMLAEVIAFGTAHGDIHKLQLSVYPDNDAAIALYRQMGFVAEARLVKQTREPDGAFRDELQMYLWVGG